MFDESRRGPAEHGNRDTNVWLANGQVSRYGRPSPGAQFGMYPATEIALHLYRVSAAQPPIASAVEGAFRLSAGDTNLRPSSWPMTPAIGLGWAQLRPHGSRLLIAV